MSKKLIDLMIKFIDNYDRMSELERKEIIHSIKTLAHPRYIITNKSIDNEQ